MSKSSTVINIPGEMELTVISGAAMIASVFTRWICAAFDTEYGYSRSISTFLNRSYITLMGLNR